MFNIDDDDDGGLLLNLRHVSCINERDSCGSSTFRTHSGSVRSEAPVSLGLKKASSPSERAKNRRVRMSKISEEKENSGTAKTRVPVRYLEAKVIAHGSQALSASRSTTAGVFPMDASFTTAH